MKRFIHDIDNRLLANKPVLWVSSMHWILALCFLIVFIEMTIGIFAKPSAELSVFYILALLTLVLLLFLWISFQYRNYDKIFTIRQTFRIYLYNILSYIFICTTSLLLSVIMHFKFIALTTPEQFSKDLLSVRIANLRNSDIDFIVSNPQVFTSKGALGGIDTSSSIDLKSEIYTRTSMDDLNPLIQSNISSSFNAALALRKVAGFKELDSFISELEKQNPQNSRMVTYYSADIEDPIFYKYIKSLSQIQLDSIRNHSNDVLTKYGISKSPADTSTDKIKAYFSDISEQVDQVLVNSEISEDKIFLTILLLMTICSITFNFILTKNVLCLFTPFIYLSLLFLGSALFYPFTKSVASGDNKERLAMVLANVLLLGLIMIVLRWRRKLNSNKNLVFFINQVQNLTALGFFIILYISVGDSALVAEIWKLPFYIIAIAGFLITHYFFIRRMHHTLIQEI